MLHSIIGACRLLHTIYSHACALDISQLNSVPQMLDLVVFPRGIDKITRFIQNA